VAELGVQGHVGATLHLSDATVVAARVVYDRNPHKVAGDRSQVYGAEVLIGYELSVAEGVELTPWGGLGGVVHSRKSSAYPGLDASQNGLMLTMGATVARAFERVTPFVSGFYARGLGDVGRDSYPTEWFTIGAGLEVPLGRE